MRFFTPLAIFGLVATSVAAPTKRQSVADIDALASQLQTAVSPYASQVSSDAAAMPADSTDPLSGLTNKLAQVLEAAVAGAGEVQTAGGLLSATRKAELLSPVFQALQTGLADVTNGVRSASGAQKRDIAALEDMILILRKDTLTDYLNAKAPPMMEQPNFNIFKRQSLSVTELNQILGEIATAVSPSFNQLTDFLESLGLPPAI
ncbi:hypothetical protein MBLNU457_5712t1 [Dothideomycetes sp. NU457]